MYDSIPEVEVSTTPPCLPSLSELSLNSNGLLTNLLVVQVKVSQLAAELRQAAFAGCSQVARADHHGFSDRFGVGHGKARLLRRRGGKCFVVGELDIKLNTNDNEHKSKWKF